MSRYQILPAAREDLDGIWFHIASDNLDAADRMVNEIEKACRRLADFPSSGHVREDLTPKPYRFWPVRSYLIVYLPESKPLRIVAILHGARDVSRVLRRR